MLNVSSSWCSSGGLSLLQIATTPHDSNFEVNTALQVLFSCFIASEGNISILYFRRRFYFFFFVSTLLPVLGLRRIKCLCTEIIECDINFSWGFSVWQQSVRQSNRYILLFFERRLSVVRFIYIFCCCCCVCGVCLCVRVSSVALSLCVSASSS